MCSQILFRGSLVPSEWGRNHPHFRNLIQWGQVVQNVVMVPFTLHHLCHHQAIWHTCVHPGDLHFFGRDFMRGPTLVQSNAWANMESKEFLKRKKNTALHTMDLEALLPSPIPASLHVFIWPYVISFIKTTSKNGFRRWISGYGAWCANTRSRAQTPRTRVTVMWVWQSTYNFSAQKAEQAGKVY